MDQGFRAGGLAVPSDFPSTAMQRFGIRVAEFELDMLAVRLDRFAADAKLFRDVTAAVPSSDRENTAISRLLRTSRPCGRLRPPANLCMAAEVITRWRKSRPPG